MLKVRRSGTIAGKRSRPCSRSPQGRLCTASARTSACTSPQQRIPASQSQAPSWQRLQVQRRSPALARGPGTPCRQQRLRHPARLQRQSSGDAARVAAPTAALVQSLQHVQHRSWRYHVLLSARCCSRLGRSRRDEEAAPTDAAQLTVVLQ
jgi:hypothetical protein